jgi:hypothetical protein
MPSNGVRGPLSAEDQLLLELCRIDITVEGANRAALLIQNGPDWGYVLDSSIRHAVAPMLKHGLDALADMQGLEDVPRTVMEDLTELYRGSGRRNARIFEALREITAAMCLAGAEPVALKDVQLAVDIYPDAALRPMGDVDLLVRRDDWDAAAACLESLGFRPLPSSDVPYIRKYATAQHFRRADDELWIDLQWNVMQREWDLYGDGSFTYDGAAMWNDAVAIEKLDFPLRAPALEDMLFHLCLHLEGHRYSELILFCDIAELLRRKKHLIDWTRLVELAQRYGAQASVYYVLRLSERLLNAPVPEGAMHALEPTFFPGVLRDALYGNLTPLHLTLDDIRVAARPPRNVLTRFERVVRTQSARAMRLDEEFNQLIASFLEHGGTLAIADGTTSPRLLPDTSLDAFEPIRLLVLEHDRRLLEEALARRGFTSHAASSPGLTKRVAIVSHDPVIAGTTNSIEIEAEWAGGVAALLGGRGAPRTSAGRAVRSLRNNLITSRADDACAVVPLALAPLTAECLVAVLAAGIGRAHEDRLFRACSLVEVLRKLPTPLDLTLIGELAEQHQVRDEVIRGLATAFFVLGQSFEGAEQSQVRVLEWARYGPADVNRFPWLRAPYYFALSMLVTNGIAQKLRYLGRALGGSRNGPPILPLILLEAGRGLIRTALRSKASFRDLAYWIDPATAERLRYSARRDEP